MLRITNILVAVLLYLSTASAALADTFELLMFERAGCIYCARWDREVGAAYALTPQGQQAPLRRISLDNGQPKGLGLETPVRYSPTFVLMKDGRESGRITGYMSDAMFWGVFAKMLETQQNPVAQGTR
jgi:thioredoxin-related protein